VIHSDIECQELPRCPRGAPVLQLPPGIMEKWNDGKMEGWVKKRKKKLLEPFFQ
jgi:hypothetical protein